MAEGINTDKVIVNAGGSGDGGGGSMAAVIAALGNRNQGGDNAALIAALGNRNDGHRGDDGFGLGGGGGILGVIALLGLLRGRGGLGGGDDCGSESSLGREFLMSKLGTIEGSVPLAAANVENAVCRAEGSVTNSINQAQLALLASNSNLKDTVQNAATVLLGSGNQNTKEILGAICALGSKIDQNEISNLQRQLVVAQSDAQEERHARRVKDVEVNVSNTAVAQQTQQQNQWQTQRFEDERFKHLSASIIAAIGNVSQRSRADQDIVNLGTMLGAGIQTPTTTQVGRQ